MKPEGPDNPRTWLLHARSNLLLAEKGGKLKDVLLEDLCINAQQAAEKALKAICVSYGLGFPKSHSIVHLMDILETKGVKIPKEVKEGDILTQYAVQTRYPSWVEKITKDEYIEALKLAAQIVFWAESLVE